MDLNDGKLNFLGVRGSCSTGSDKDKTYGGNTSCIELSLGNTNLILDAGTGIHKALKKIKVKETINILLTHLHWDHIIGLPFLQDLYNKEAVINIYGPKQKGVPLEDCLKNLFQQPFFPIAWEDLKANISIYELDDSDAIQLSNLIKVSTYNTYHSELCLAYRIQDDSNSICYVTDIDYRCCKNKQSLIEFVRNSDILIMDTTYTPEEYSRGVEGKENKCLGHSTWEDAVNLATEGNVGKLYLFHHSVERTDRELEEILEKCRTIFKETYIACENY